MGFLLLLLLLVLAVSMCLLGWVLILMTSRSTVLLLMVMTAIVVIPMSIVVRRMVARVVLSRRWMHTSMHRRVSTSHVVSRILSCRVVWIMILWLAFHIFFIVFVVLGRINRVHSIMLVSFTFIILLFFSSESLHARKETKKMIQRENNLR